MKKPNYGNIARSLFTDDTKATDQKKSDPGVIMDARKPEINYTQKGLKPGETRTTFIVDVDTLERFKLVAYWERTTIKDLLNECMEAAISSYTKTHGPLKPKVKRRKA